MPNKIDALYSEVSKSYEVGSIDDFKKYLADPKKRQLFFKEIIAPEYDVKSIDDFDEAYGFKKKSTESPSQGAQKDIFSVSGETPKAGPSEPSAKPPSNKLQEELFQKTRLAASVATASAKPGYTPVPKEEAKKAFYGKANVESGTLRGIPGETKSTVANLNDKYKNLGVQFKEAPSKIQKGFGLGDIVVTADDGSTHIVQSTGADEKLREEEAKLQEFLMGKSAGAEKKEITPMEFLMMSRDGISPEEENKFKRVYSQELVDNSIKFANNELEKTKNGVDKVQSEMAKLNEEAMIGGVTPEIESRFFELQKEQEKNINYAKSIASLTDEGVKKAAGENVRIMGDQGNLPSALYNSLLKFAENSAIGVMDIANQGATLAYSGLAKLASVNMGVDVSAEDLGSSKEAREMYTKAVDDVMSSIEADVSEQYVQSLPTVLKALVGAAEFVPNMLIPAANIRYGVLVSQGVGRRMTELNDSPTTKDLPENEKFFMSAVPAMVEAALENFGISQWAGMNKGLISSVTVDVLSKVVPQAGMRGVKKLINAEINNLVLKGATNVVGAMASEFETGALQSISDTAFRQAYEIAKGKDLFKQPGFGEEGFKEALLEDAKMEALGGMWMAGAANIAQQTSEYVTGKSNTNETFALMKQILASNTTESALSSTLKSQILSGKISKEQAQNTFRNFREAKAIVRDIPQDLSEDNQRAAFDLLAEKRKLTKQIEGKDPSLVNKQKKRITEIDNKLIEISNAVQKQATSEVPVQPEARVGEEVVEGKPQPEPEVVTEEGQVQEEVTQYIADLQETKQSDPEQYWSVDSVTEEAAKEGTVISDEDGGVVVSKDGDIKGLFKKAASKAKGVAQKLLQKAVQAGGIKLDNFDNYLTPVYEKAGFRVVSRVPFNEEYAPEGWNKEKHGTPDVVAMVYDPQNKLDIQEQKFENYDEAMAYRDQLVEQAKTEYPMQSNFDEAVNKSAQALNVVAPGLKVIVGENVDDVQNQIVEAIAPLIGERQAVQTAEEFAKGTKGQTIFVDGKPFAVVFDKTTADSRTAGHEAWEVMLNDAFGNDQARFKEFSDSIDAQLRAQGFGDIADALDAFASQRGYEAVKYSEYMAELGGMLVEAGFGKGPLTAQQKTLLQKIGDIINKFAELFTGKKQFLDQATPEDILGFMVTISNKVAKGEDVASFFRAKEVKPSKTDKSGNLESPTVKSRNQLKEKTSDIEKKVKASVSPGNIVSTRIPAKGDPHSKSNLVINTESIMKEAKENKNAEKFAITIARKVADYPIVNVSPESINTLEDANKVFEKLKEGVKGNLKWLYDQFSDEVRTITKLWYDGANKISNEISKEYGYTLDQVAGVMAVLSPQMDWFRNLSLGRRVIDIYNTKQEYSLDDKMANYMLNAKSEGKMLFNEKLTKKEIGLLVEEMKGKKFKELSLPEKAFFVRAYDEVYNTRDYENISPTGEVNGFVRNADGSRGKVGWGGFGPIIKSISILEDGKIKNISENLGEQHKVRNFFNNISSPNDKNAVTIDTHAVAAALLEPLAGSDEQVALNLGGPKTNSIGSVGTYAIYADAYRELASELGILPRELQSITWEAVRGLYKAKFKQSKKNKQAIKDIWEQFRNKEKNIKEVYESINEKAGGVSKPVWYEYVAEGDGKTYEENSAAVDQAKLSEDYQLGQSGGRTEPIEVTTRSQKNVPPVVDEVLTDDGKGNYLFVHYSNENRDVIKPMSGSKSNFTSREEVSAISAVGGVAMYYTKAGQKESGVGDVPHTVLVPKDKVYFYGSTEKGTVSHDPEGFEEEARQRFQAYRNRGNEDRPTKYAFDANNSAAWVTKVAAENGYDMLVTNWGGPKSYRAQTTKALKPEAEYTGFKKPEPVVFEVGDEISLYGRYATIVDVDGDVLTYESPNAFGRFDTGKFTLSPYTSYKITMIEKAKPSVTTRSQKVEVKTIPGYDRMMNEVEGIMDKTINRGGSYNQASANAINYIQKSASYERADDIQREQIIRDFKKIRGEKFKVAPSVAKILGQIEDVKKITVKESTALKDQIKLEAKAAKDSAAFVKQLRMDISGRLKSMVGRGMMSARQATAIISRYDKMNILNPVMRDRFVDYMSRVFQSAEYMDKVKEATMLRKTIRKAAKNPDNQAESSKLAKTFAEIDPSRVENIDDYINNAEQILKSVSRKTGDVKMRSLVNMTDMVSYIDKEIQAQREQIKNEILSKYQDLVDAGVLDSKMTINEIQKVVDSIKETEDESEAKAQEAKAAVKQMMGELSPILIKIARTGEDPFTGDPIDLTPDEKRDLVRLANMDLDSLSLADSLKAVEYANNFISNGIFSGIGAIVSINEGSLEPAKLKKDGVMSLRLRKYFFPGAGRKWAEQIGTLTLLNKLLFLSNEKAIMVANASGESGIANGKARAIKIVEKAVKEYTDKFSSLKDFRTGENIIERGILAFVSRTVIGDKFQAQDEFNRRKSLIEETIQALKDPNNSTDTDIKKGELIEKVYDKVLKDSKNVNDVRAKVSDVNKKAVDWWVNEWSKHYDRMDEVSRSVYNTLLTRDANFTPDRFQSIDLTTASENDFDSSFFGSFENVSTEKSGSLKENKRIKNLPSDKNGAKTRIVNLDFDMNNANALTNALIDVETASSVLKAKGFVTSKDFGKIFSSKDDAKLYKRRLIAYVNNVRGKNYVDQSEITNMGKSINAIGSFGTAKALFSLSQPLKQSIPPLFNTLVQTRRLDLGTLFSGGNAFIDRTGYPIINRGISSLAELQAINKKIAEVEKNLLAKGIMGIAEYNNKMLELWLQKPDVFTARSSWLSYYINSLKKQGIYTKGIDWNTHEVNKKAADYAEIMVSSQQNVNDSDMQGMLFTDKTPYAKAVRKALFTLMTFTLNQKTRIWSDMRTLSNKKLTSEADRKEALLSLAGAIVELVSFHSISLGVSYIVLQPLIDAMMEALGYDDDDEDKELEKKKLLMNKSGSIAQSFLKDFILPPIPGIDALASSKVNSIMDEYGISEKIAVEGFGMEEGESKFELYDKQDYSFLDVLGGAGIAVEKGKELFDFTSLASTGKFDVETKGGLITKQIQEENEDLAKINASIMSAYYLGILPGELAYIARKLDKKIKKGAEKVEEESD